MACAPMLSWHGLCLEVRYLELALLLLLEAKQLLALKIEQRRVSNRGCVVAQLGVQHLLYSADPVLQW